MTVHTNLSTKSYTTNGTTVTFPFDFPVSTSADVVVLVNGVNVNGSCSIVLNEPQLQVPGGYIHFALDNFGIVSTPGKTLSISRVVDYTQDLDFSGAQALSPLQIESALDRLTMMVQQHSVETIIPPPVVIAPIVVPGSVTPTEGSALVWNAAGELINSGYSIDLAMANLYDMYSLMMPQLEAYLANAPGFGAPNVIPNGGLRGMRRPCDGTFTGGGYRWINESGYCMDNVRVHGGGGSSGTAVGVKLDYVPAYGAVEIRTSGLQAAALSFTVPLSEVFKIHNRVRYASVNAYSDGGTAYYRIGITHSMRTKTLNPLAWNPSLSDPFGGGYWGVMETVLAEGIVNPSGIIDFSYSVIDWGNDFDPANAELTLFVYTSQTVGSLWVYGVGASAFPITADDSSLMLFDAHADAARLNKYYQARGPLKYKTLRTNPETFPLILEEEMARIPSFLASTSFGSYFATATVSSAKVIQVNLPSHVANGEHNMSLTLSAEY